MIVSDFKCSCDITLQKQVVQYEELEVSKQMLEEDLEASQHQNEELIQAK